MERIERFFLARGTVISLILLALCAIALAAFIPQRFLTPPEEMQAWQSAHPLLCRWSNLLGLHRIYTHPGFALILAGGTISLALSTRHQALAAWQRTVLPAGGMAGDRRFSVARTPEEVSRLLMANGFIGQGTFDGEIRLVRHPWGYWGNTLLHFGMVLTIVASLCIALTQQQGVIHLAEGAIHYPSQPLLREEHGLLAGPLHLPDAVRLDRVAYRFGPDLAVRELASTLTFLSDNGVAETETVAINRILNHRGIRFYQGVEFGHAFFVEVTGPTGEQKVFQLQFMHPDTPDLPSYNDFRNLLGDGFLVRAKYLVDGEGKGFDRVSPLLTLRLDQDGREVGRLPLQPGGEGAIGQYRFRLLGFAPWSRLIMVNVTGMPLIFAGFFVICLGGVLHYFTPPRQVSLAGGAAGGTAVSWRAARFSGFYRDEPDSLKRMVNGGGAHG